MILKCNTIYNGTILPIVVPLFIIVYYSNYRTSVPASRDFFVLSDKPHNYC